MVRVARLLVVALGRAVVIEMGLRLTTLPRLASWLGVPLDTGRRDAAPPAEVPAERLTASQQARLAAIGTVYRRWPFGDTCLRRALASGHTLRSRTPVLRVGVTRRGGAVRAHAWIEFDGMSLGSDPDGGVRGSEHPPIASRGVYELLGLRVDTPLALPGAIRSDGRADVVVGVGQASVVPFDQPEGELLADRVAEDGERWYCLSRGAAGYVLRLPALCDLHVSLDLGHAEFTPADGITDEHLSIVLSGTAISTLVMLGGSIVLHGSAVERGGRAIGFLGDSGQGKSTLAAACCATGWRLLADDAMRIDLDGRAMCPPGSREIRLRSAPISDPAWPSRTTIDLRQAVSPPASEAAARLDALVIPFPDRAAEAVTAQRLGQVPAIQRLLYYLRVAGWRDPDILRGLFRQAAGVAAEVGVWEVTVPWGEGFVPSMIEKLTAAVTSR